MPYLIIVGLDLFCLMHCLKRCGKGTWVFVILGIPILGALLYLFVEVRPEWEQRSRRDRANANPLRHRPAEYNPRRSKQAKGDLHPHLQTASDLMQQDQPDQAAAIYRTCLIDLPQDPELLTCLAQAKFAQAHYAMAIDALNQVRALSDYKPTFIRLLLAMSYAEAGEAEKAHRLYEGLLRADPQPEVKVRYALYLEAQGQHYRCQELLKEVASLPADQLKAHDLVWFESAQESLAKT